MEEEKGVELSENNAHSPKENNFKFLESETAPQSNQNSNSQISGFHVLSGLFVILAISLSAFGLSVLYDNSYKAQIVGGDAYNYIIYATRGTAWVCAGIVSAVISVVFALFAQPKAKD